MKHIHQQGLTYTSGTLSGEFLLSMPPFHRWGQWVSEGESEQPQGCPSWSCTRLPGRGTVPARQSLTSVEERGVFLTHTQELMREYKNLKSLPFTLYYDVCHGAPPAGCLLVLSMEGLPSPRPSQGRRAARRSVIQVGSASLRVKGSGHASGAPAEPGDGTCLPSLGFHFSSCLTSTSNNLHAFKRIVSFLKPCPLNPRAL